jgi:hypothetical protein
MPTVGGVRPCATHVTLRTAGARRFPLNGDVVAFEAGLFSGLPAVVAAGGPQHLDPEAGLMCCQGVGVDLARVDELTAGEPVATG